MSDLSFKNWIKNKSNIHNLGKVAVFYLPSKKITKKIRSYMHEFLISNYEAYTHESSNIKGYWVSNNSLVKDIHERYEVSFKGNYNFKKFVNFLIEVCKLTKEDAIYLTFANNSYLIKPD